MRVRIRVDLDGMTAEGLNQQAIKLWDDIQERIREARASGEPVRAVEGDYRKFADRKRVGEEPDPLEGV